MSKIPRSVVVAGCAFLLGFAYHSEMARCPGHIAVHSRATDDVTSELQGIPNASLPHLSYLRKVGPSSVAPANTADMSKRNSDSNAPETGTTLSLPGSGQALQVQAVHMDVLAMLNSIRAAKQPLIANIQLTQNKRSQQSADNPEAVTEHTSAVRLATATRSASVKGTPEKISLLSQTTNAAAPTRAVVQKKPPVSPLSQPAPAAGQTRSQPLAQTTIHNAILPAVNVKKEAEPDPNEKVTWHSNYKARIHNLEDQLNMAIGKNWINESVAVELKSQRANLEGFEASCNNKGYSRHDCDEMEKKLNQFNYWLTEASNGRKISANAAAQ